MAMFLAKCKVTKSEYMCEDKPDRYIEHKLVDADDYHAAERKIELYYADKCSSYAVNYTVDILSIEEAIT